ncbi:hypothetical protein [Nocardia sp. NRRL S-836]|uniref:Uncharacterized protein n=1 Tax=Lentzea sp. NRRL S-836 TaxID=1415540 RepID=U5YS41_9PSEU|nr:hypothetical protein [Nocardia sp. NRRL S-836]AGZ94456.1 hypothetical protein [Lentzea sp. NRRL S-836]KOV86294.1 hypothetical protein ADL03_09025 [Nocardia sp. NRRL S-836]
MSQNVVLAHTLLGREPSPDLIRSIAEVAVRTQYPDTRCPRYFEALDQALRDEPPPFGTAEYGLIYRSLSVEPRWMGISLITNSEREGDGSRRLWSLAACSVDPRHQRLLKRHACDESRHSLIYLSLLDLTFPGAVSPEFRAELRQLSPGFTMRRELFPIPGSPYARVPTIDDFLQMNIAEIRTTVHHAMQRPALAAHCPPENQDKITRLHDALLTDELSHIAYTAVLVEEIGRHADPDRFAALFRKRLHDFNTITTEELGGNVFDCSVACCARRPTCRAKVGDPEPVLHQIGMGRS